ncbi:MAG: FliM/FliN family flagellar motor switch protein [Planctomycetota bacterium]|jgi:flagellar motor switch protein FliN/FliY
MADELDNLENLLNSGPEMSLADPAMIEAGEKISSTIWNSGTEGLGVLLNRGVMYTDGGSDYNELSEIIAADIGECVVTNADWTGDREGSIILFIPALGAKGIISYMLALMMGTEADPENTSLDEEGMDAYKEAISQFFGSASQALRQDPGGEVKIAVGDIEVKDFGTESIAEIYGNDFRLCSQGQLTIEGMSPVNIYTVLTEALTGVEISLQGEETGAADLDSTIEEAKSQAGLEELDPDKALSLIAPVHVTLAERKMRLSEIMQMVPGSIVEFRKSSEEFLDLCVGHTIIGRGEAVIIDEYFGLQIREMFNKNNVKRSLD